MAGIAVFPLLAYQVPVAVGQDAAYVVLSGSMEPLFAPGDIIFTENVRPHELRVGDVITFRALADEETFFTHRIVEIVDGEDGSLFITQGDANASPDAAPVSPDRVEGRYNFHVPYYGYVMGWGQTKVGFFAMIIGPSLFIIGLQVRTMVQALGEIEKQAKEKKAAKERERQAVMDRAAQQETLQVVRMKRPGRAPAPPAANRRSAT